MKVLCAFHRYVYCALVKIQFISVDDVNETLSVERETFSDLMIPVNWGDLYTPD